MRNYTLNENTTTNETFVWLERITKERKAAEYKQRRDNRQTKRWATWIHLTTIVTFVSVIPATAIGIKKYDKLYPKTKHQFVKQVNNPEQYNANLSTTNQVLSMWQ